MIQLLSLYHQNKWQRLFNSNFWLYELSVWLHTFSRVLIAVFIPIFIYQIGYSIQEVIIYYIIFYLIDIPFNLVAKWLIQKIGARWLIIVASCFSFAFFISLYALRANDWGLLLLIALFAAIYDTFYWISHIYIFMKASSHNKNVSKDTSSQLIIKKTASIIAPALGAAIIIFFDRQVLIIISMIFLILSVIPLFKLRRMDDRPKKRPKSFTRFFKKWSIVKDYVMAGFWSMHSGSENIIFPLFIFLSFSSIQSVALLPIIVSFTSIVFIYFMGKAPRKKRNKLIMIGALVISLMWLTRIFINSALLYYISVFLVGLAAIFISIPLYSTIYEKGRKRDPLDTATYRNMTHMIFKLIMFSILALAMNIFKTSFIIGAVSMLVIITIGYIIVALIQPPKKRFYIFNK